MDMAEIRVTVSEQLKKRLQLRTELLGVREPEYVRSLLIEDLKNG